MSDQSANNKRIAKNTLLLYFRMLLTMAVSLYTSRVVLQTLGVVDYGIYNVVGGVVTMFTFINAAMSSATQRFLTFELGCGNIEKLHKVFCISLEIHALISLAIVILAETIGLWFLDNQMNIPEERINAAHWVYQFSVLSTIVMIMSVPYNASIVAHEKMSAFAYISLLEVILKLSIVYILIIFNADKLILYAVLMFLVQMFIRLIYGFYCRLHFKECIFNYFYDKRLLNNIFTFSGWTILGHMSSVVSSQGLNILLNIFCGPVVNAARAITVQIQHAVQGFVLNFQTAINPQITKNYAKRNIEQMHSLIYASCRYSFFLLLFLSQPILLKCEYLLSLWLETVPNHTANFIRLTLLLTMLEAISNPLIIAAQATGNIKKYQIIIGSILLSIIPFSFILLEKGYMPVSVFILQNIITAIALFARLLLLRKMIFLSLRMFIRSVILKIIYVTCASMIVSIVLLFIIPQTTLWGLILVCILCMCSTLVLIYFLGLNKTERQFVVQKICKKTYKI